MGVASGWILWVWLQCIGVVGGCCCKEVYNYIDILTIIINFPYTCISSFLAAASLLLCSFLKCFLFLFMLFLYNIIIAKVNQRIFDIVQKNRDKNY